MTEQVPSAGQPFSRIEVNVDPPYPVIVGRDLTSQLASLIPPSAARVMVLFAPPMRQAVGVVDALLRTNDLEVHLAELPEAEAGKTIQVAAAAWRRLGLANFTRSDVVVSLGGGATSDIAGFVAATWLRGVPVIHLPTTLLGMVDAAVGGKTGLNTTEGKNLVGAFHQPLAVLCDLLHLTTLPREELINGLAEVIKCGLIADKSILDLVLADPLQCLDPAGPVLAQLIAKAVAVKAHVVSADPNEQGWRAVLNYGHTFGHAIEQVENYQWRHGLAVAVGMVFEAEVAVRCGVMRPELLHLHRALLTGVGLPTTYQPGQWDQLYEAMGRDKKNHGHLKRMVVLEDVAKPALLENVDEAILQQAYQAVTVSRSTAPPTAPPKDEAWGLAPGVPRHQWSGGHQ